MNTFLKTSFLPILAVIILASCQKEGRITITEPIAEENISSFQQEPGKLVSATLKSSLPAVDAIDNALSELKSYSTEYGSLIDNSLTAEDLIKFNIGDFNVDYKLLTYTITYSSITRVNGEFEPVTLTGDVSFIADASGRSSTRKLESVSLYHTIYNTSTEDSQIVEPMIMPARAAYNALVVFPFFQGTFSDKGKHVVAPSEPVIKAVQALDCEMAAFELIESLDGVYMKPDYYTENIGISNGGGSALAVQYLLENNILYHFYDVRYVRNYADKIRLKSTYIGEGNCSTKEMFPLLLSNFHSGVLSFFDINLLAPVGYITSVVGAYKTWQDLFGNIELEDFFSDDFLKDSNNYLQKYLDGTISLMFTAVQDDTYDLKTSEIVNPDMLDGDEINGYTFKTDNDKYIALMNALSKNDCILSGWTPKANIMFAHCITDEFLYYEDAVKLYSNLSNNGSADNVFFKSIYGFDHFTSSSVLFFVDAILKKHPCPIN